MDDWQSINDATPVPNREWLRDRTIETHAQLVVAEAENVRKAHVKYLAATPNRRSAPFDYAWVLRLHEEMLGKVWKFAGKVRSDDLNMGVKFHLIEPMLYDLVTGDLPFWENEPSMTAMSVAVRLHYKAVYIHPFRDGNGRWARMLANIWLKQQREPCIDWPATVMEPDHPIRQRYVGTLKAADEGDFDPLIDMQSEYLARESG